MQSSLFIGARGVVSRNCLDTTVTRNPEDACQLWRSEGDVFTRIQEFSWNLIVGVNPLPQGASVGELGKTLTPSKRRLCRNSIDKFANHSRDENSSFVKVKHSWRDPDEFLSVFMFSSNVPKWWPNLAPSRESAIYFRIIETCEDLEIGTCEALETGTCEVLESRIHEDRELQRAVIFVNKRFENQGEAKSRTSSLKSGIECELVESL
jgi:hypothetical protein